MSSGPPGQYQDMTRCAGGSTGCVPCMRDCPAGESRVGCTGVSSGTCNKDMVCTPELAVCSERWSAALHCEGQCADGDFADGGSCCPRKWDCAKPSGHFVLANNCNQTSAVIVQGVLHIQGLTPNVSDTKKWIIRGGRHSVNCFSIFIVTGRANKLVLDNIWLTQGSLIDEHCSSFYQYDDRPPPLGAAILNFDATIHITNCNFTDFRALRGGAILQRGTASIRNSSFIRCASTNGGGAIGDYHLECGYDCSTSIEGSVFDENRVLGTEQPDDVW